MRWTTRQPGRSEEPERLGWVTVAHAVRRLATLACALLVVLIVAGCAPANERPLRGAVPGSDAAPTPPGVPPTLTASDALRFKALPVAIAGHRRAARRLRQSRRRRSWRLPPIVRTIAPGANGARARLARQSRCRRCWSAAAPTWLRRRSASTGPTRAPRSTSAARATGRSTPASRWATACKPRACWCATPSGGVRRLHLAVRGR